MNIGYYGVILHECQQSRRGSTCDSKYFSRHICRKLCFYLLHNTQGDSREKEILINKVRMSICLILIELSESPDLTPFDNFMWGWMKSEVYTTNCFSKLASFRLRIARSHFRHCRPHKRNQKINEENAIFAQQLQSALRLTAEFSKICCEL